MTVLHHQRIQQGRMESAPNPNKHSGKFFEQIAAKRNKHFFKYNSKFEVNT